MQRFAVFDIDKNLYKGTLAHDFVEGLIDEGVMPADLEALRVYQQTKARRSGRAELDTSLVATLKEAQGSGKLKFADYVRVGQEVADRALMNGKFFEFNLNKFREYKNDGRTTIAISTSPYAVVFPFCSKLGFNFTLAPMAQNVDGFLGPRSIIKADEKDKGVWLSEIVTILGLTYEGSFGSGDSMSDAPMLALVEHPVAFNPDPSLQALAVSKGWEVVTED